MNYFILILLSLASILFSKDYTQADERCTSGYADSSKAFPPTEICGPIALPTNLRKCQSPYLVTDDIYVPASSRLRIEAGVELIISDKRWCTQSKDSTYARVWEKWRKQHDWNDSQYISIKVDGAFFVAGTPDAPVIIRPKNSAVKTTHWDGIRLTDKNRATTQIEHLHISGANRAIFAQHCTFNVANSLFINNNVGIYMDNLSEMPIYNSLFIENFSTGIYHYKSGAKLYANIFYNNFNYGVWSDSRHSLVVMNNIFYGNKEFDCFHCPLEVSKMTTVNENNDSTDRYFNLFTNPIFVGTAQEALEKKKDLDLNTPVVEIKDSILYHLEMRSRQKKGLGITPPPPFIPRGPEKGVYRLSKYSKGRGAAPDHTFFLNTDSTRGDIGMYGGTGGRVSEKFPK